MRDRHQSVRLLCVLLILCAVPRLIGAALGHHVGVGLPIACWSLAVGTWGLVTLRSREHGRVPRATARRRP